MQSVADISVLLIEADADVRTQVRKMLSLCGIRNVNMAVTASSAVRKLRDITFDVILCEHHLGGGQDGQHLLEDLRQHKLISPSTVFIMATGESSYENVIGTVEQGPTDFILKPFSADLLLERLQRAIQKRDAFMPTFLLLEAGNAAEAMNACRKSEAEHPEYRIDLMRLRADMLITAGEAAEAQAVYQQVLKKRAAPWAKLGLAKTLYLLKQYESAEVALEALVAENALYLDAYDWLARTREAMGKLEQAQAVLRNAVAVSPHTIRRLRKLGEVSSELGDMSTAATVMKEVVHASRQSDFRDPEDHILLVKAQLAVGEVNAASATLDDLERNVEGSPKTALCQALAKAMLATQAGDTKRADKALDEITKLNDPGMGTSLALKKNLAHMYLENKRDGKAAEVMMEVMRNAADDAEVDRAKNILADLGKPELGEWLATRVREEVRNIMTEGVKLANNGDFDGAVRQMQQAVNKMPGNTNVLFNAALALLKHIENLGWNQKFAVSAREYIERVRRQDPGYPKLASMATYFDTLMKKYSVRV